MNYLIRFISRNAAGGSEQTDKRVAAETITIGRATDQVLHIKDRRARLQHARIERRGDGFHIVSATVGGVVVNGRSQRDARLAVDDVIEIGSNILRVIEAPDDADFAITFELSATATEDHFVADWSTSLATPGRFSKRRLSWTLAIAVLVLTLVLPGLSLFEPVAAVTRGTALPDDGWWLTGAVHSAHSSVAEQCDACHVTPFERVPDSACLACHEAARHVDEGGEAVLGVARCASCHHEHNEPAELVNRHQDLCADCHRAPSAAPGLEPVSDFLDAHPEFRVSLLQPPDSAEKGNEWQTARLSPAAARGADRSNLAFDHAVHLDADGILTPEGRRIVECGECHEPEPGGAGMKPVVMDEHCSSCHTLAFDPDDPARSVPHGDPEAVVTALVEYYSARLLGDDPDTAEQRLRRPGRTMSREDRDRVAAEARTRALSIAEDLFERRACSNCHEVTRLDDGDVPWQVRPVRLTDTFFVHARFDHGAHRTEVTACDGCHDASRSATASDVLIPGIDRCRDCHGSGFDRRNTAAQLPSTCVLCHRFHFDARGLYP